MIESGALEMKNSLKEYFEGNKQAFEESFEDINLDVLENAAGIMIDSLKAGRKILLCGNGGSAADCQHFAAELVGRFRKERKGYPAIALTTDSSVLTSWSNDYDFETVFSRQVESLGEAGDVLIVISTSGNSANAVKAAETAREKGIKVIGFTGSKGNKLKELSDVCFSAFSNQTSHVQEVHITALHSLCNVIEDVLTSGD